MNAREVGERIAALRRGNGLTQKKLAERIYVTDKAVSKWERGLNFPELSTVAPLASALGVSPAVLLGLEEKAPEEVLTASTEIHEEERIRWHKELRSRAWWSTLCCLTIFAGMTWLSRLMSSSRIYRQAEPVYTGMNGVIGTLMGNVVYTLRTVRRQLRRASEKQPSAPDRSA